MLPPNLNKWKLNRETENLLFFAQLIEEMLFNFSLEHFKLPALNTHTLCMELLGVLKQVDSRLLDPENLSPIGAELKAEIDRDPALDTLLGNQKANITRDLEDSTAGPFRHAAHTLNNLLATTYLPATVTLLRKKITDGDKEGITALTKNYLTELTYRGYSLEYIFFENKNHFFEGAEPKSIEDLSAFDAFVDLFPLEPKTWTVVFRTGKDFKYLREFPPQLNVTAGTEKPDLHFPRNPENIGIFLDRKFKLPHYLCFQNVTALDGFSARYAMEEKLLLVDGLAKFHVHRTELEWSRAALIFDAEKKHVGVFSKPVPAAMKRLDQNARQSSVFINDTAGAIFSENLSEASSLKLSRALKIHEMALKAPAPETQLRELLSMLELLFEPQEEEEERVPHLITRVVPYLIIGFPAKLAADLIKSIRNAGSKEAVDILYGVEHGHNLIEKCLLLVFTEENRQNRERLCRCLGSHPLLVHRIDSLSRAFISAPAIRASLEAYAGEIAWQIHRAFRAVKLGSHSGSNVSVVNKLVENIHSIADRVMNVLLDEISRKKTGTTIERIHQEILLQSQRHFEILEMRKDEICGRDNFNCLLFGDENPV
ncbi:MAG: hypothetical protein JXK94_15170 [Deltaproteobacteria bacterium]|nr:hypothetical protein [Deltaproteobacteria bacterium]